MRRKVLLLVNGSAGQSAAMDRVYEMIEELTLQNCLVTAVPILPADGVLSEDVLRETDHDYFDVVACCGGDGTLHYVINGLLEEHYDVPVGYIPTGSANDFARGIGISEEFHEQIDAIASGREFAYDIGRFNDRYFNYIAAFGAFTAISYSTDQDAKNAIGYGAYAIEAVLNLYENLNMSYHMKVELNGMEIEDDFIFGSVSSSQSVGGLKTVVSNRAQYDDGLFEVMLIKKPKNIGDLQKILAGLDPNAKGSPNVSVYQTDHVRFTSEENIDWTLDGEFGGSVKEANITVKNRAMRILLPK